MNATIKKMCLFGLASTLGEVIEDQSKDKEVKWRAVKLKESADEAIYNLRSEMALTRNKMKQFNKKINELTKEGTEFDSLFILSFLFMGFDELMIYCKDKTYIEPLYKRTLWFIKLFDTKLQEELIHAKAEIAYREWVLIN